MKERYQVTLTKEYVDAYKIDAIRHGPNLSLSFMLDEHLRELYGDGIEPAPSKSVITRPAAGDIKTLASSLGMTKASELEVKNPFMPTPVTYPKRQEIGPDGFPIIQEEHYDE